MPDGASLERYREIVDDWPAFERASARPLPRTLWANPILADLEAVAGRVREDWPLAEELSWRPYTWRIPHDSSVGGAIPYRLGWLHAQEEAALWAVDAMSLSPGARVLDLCASPGNKTAQIAIALADRGLVVANERKAGRIAALRSNLDRLGITSAAVVQSDGVRFRSDVVFDAVLVDAPCTCEGTARRHLTGRGRDGVVAYRASIRQTQIALLRNAVRHVRRGGVVVYSTCTYAPEENEAVIDRIDGVDIVPIPDPGIRTSPGIAAWDDTGFKDDVRHARRVWPHYNDTGGFFVARLRKR